MLGMALINVCASAAAKAPTCTQPVGKWRNERGSVLDIRNYDAATGAISGQYLSNSGTTGSHPMMGWLNSAPAETGASCKGCKLDRAEVITFLVRWGVVGSVSAWNGTCAVNSQSGREQIFASWNTARPTTEFEWDHTLTGAEPFVPIE